MNPSVMQALTVMNTAVTQFIVIIIVVLVYLPFMHCKISATTHVPPPCSVRLRVQTTRVSLIVILSCAKALSVALRVNVLYLCSLNLKSPFEALQFPFLCGLFSVHIHDEACFLLLSARQFSMRYVVSWSHFQLHLVKLCSFLSSDCSSILIIQYPGLIASCHSNRINVT